MKTFKVFIFGLLYGWLLKFAIDRIYRDNEIESIRNENASLKQYIRSLEMRHRPQSAGSKSITATTAEAKPVRTESGRDDLKIIKGIGPVIERNLNDAGIHTFAALARLTTEELESILGNTRRLVKEGDLIAQAKKFAKQ